MSQDAVVSTSGWNDPPSFTYISNLPVQTSLSLPEPILIPCLHTPNDQQQQQQQQQNDIAHRKVSTENQLVEISIINVLRKSLSDCNKQFKPTILLNLNSKLDILETSLQDKSFPSPVLLILTELASAIWNKDFILAYQLHIRLIADFPTHVNSWILAVKKIITANQE